LGFVDLTFEPKFLLILFNMQDRVLLQGLEWGSSKAVDKLKKMLWGLEALRVFDDRLSASLSQIQKAREAMEHDSGVRRASHRFASRISQCVGRI
jgi:hypothetical protein